MLSSKILKKVVLSLGSLLECLSFHKPREIAFKFLLLILVVEGITH